MEEKSEENFGCGHCEKGFTTKQSLKIHLLSIHGDQRHQCETCDMTFTIKSNLRKHVLHLQ